VKEKEDSLKLNELSGDVYENKGSAFHRPGQSANVVENTGSYALKAGMSLKRKEVDGRSWAVGGEGLVPGGRSQVREQPQPTLDSWPLIIGSLGV
jgi:hypothetical protein